MARHTVEQLLDSLAGGAERVVKIVTVARTTATYPTATHRFTVTLSSSVTSPQLTTISNALAAANTSAVNAGNQYAYVAKLYAFAGSSLSSRTLTVWMAWQSDLSY